MPIPASFEDFVTKLMQNEPDPTGASPLGFADEFFNPKTRVAALKKWLNITDPNVLAAIEQLMGPTNANCLNTISSLATFMGHAPSLRS